MQTTRSVGVFALLLGCAGLSSCGNGDAPTFESVTAVDQVRPSVQVGLGVGEVAVVEGNRPFKLSTPTGYEEFVLIMTGDPEIPADDDQPYFVVAANGPRTTKHDFEWPPNSGGGMPCAGLGPNKGGPVPFACWADSKVSRYLTDGSPPMAFEPGAGGVQGDGASEPASTRSFFVLQCTSCSFTDPGSYATITADLRYEGANVLIYSDVDQPTGSFTQADYDFLGAQFDTQIHPANTTAFGSESDIDSNAKVILLYSPEVNDLTPDGGAILGFIAGFFLRYDLTPGLVPPGTSNAAELLYMMVPDPDGEYGNVFTKSLVLDVVPRTTAHEYEHLTSFGHRYLTYGWSAVQALWLEEGMAHIAEDVNGFDSQNTARANLYLSDPASVSLMGTDSIQMRGGIFLFLRYLGDRFGENIYHDIVQSSCVGESCLEDATGHGLSDIFNDFLATLYLSHRGITPDPRYNFTSFNLQSDFAPLFIVDNNIEDGVFGGTVRNATGSYHHTSGFSSGPTWLRVVGEATVRTVIIRIQ